MTIKALTISQPYASMIMRGEKWIENRVWETNYRGRLAIHAGKGKQYLSTQELANYPTSRIIAIGQLVACVSLDEICRQCADPATRNQFIPGTRYTWDDAETHEHAEGPFCWILDDVKRVVYVEISGKQGLWNYETETESQMEFAF